MSTLSEQQILSRARASSLENVKNLNFWGSDLNDISVLRRMPNVEVLSLSVNNITSLKDFAHCTILDCSSTFRFCPRVPVHKNRYKRPNNVQQLNKGPRLRELYLRKNSIRDINEIGCLKNLPKLRVLWLSDNPCANVVKYRMTVLKNLPKLTKLDTVVVEEAEVLEATNEGIEIHTPEDIPVHLDLTATVDKNTLKTDGVVSKEDLPQCSAENDNADLTQNDLVNETNKLRAQLGLKPLLLEDKPDTTKTTAVTNVPKKASETVSPSSRNQNILSAVLTLVQELDHTSLLSLRKEIDQQLQDYNHTESECLEENGPLEEKEVIAD